MRSTSTPVTLIIFSILTLTRLSVGQPTGQVQQGLVSSTVVSAADQEKYTLVTLSSGCSGSLLRNNWVITAAHCVDDDDPTRTGVYTPLSDNSVTISAAWTTPQSRQSIRIITFRPHDVAIIRVDMPFNVNGSTRTFNRDIFRDGQFPFFGTLTPVPIKAYGRGINQFAQLSGGVPMRSRSDNQFRVGLFKTNRETAGLFWYPSVSGQHIAGGDSGGPSFATVRGADEVLMGVHSGCKIICLDGMTCGRWPGPPPAPPTYSNWAWVADTPECADAPIAPHWEDINRYLGAFVPEPEAPGPQFIGTFGTTPANYQPMWVYAIKNDGEMLWYRKDTGESAWQGPKPVGHGWGFKDVIPAGGNAFYALTDEGKLMWYRHDGFNDGSRENWAAPTEVGHGWGFTKIFSGGEGIIYAITQDGKLLWYKHNAYQTGAGLETPGAWEGRKEVGTGWNGFEQVFSAGGGIIYAIAQDGKMRWYKHNGYLTGVGTPGAWEGPKEVGTGWNGFRQVLPAGAGVILVIENNGKLRWYRHNGYLTGMGTPGAWEGPKEVGTGWHGFRQVIALLPGSPGLNGHIDDQSTSGTTAGPGVGVASSEIRCRGFSKPGGGNYVFFTINSRPSSTGETLVTYEMAFRPSWRAAGLRGEGLDPGECAFADRPIAASGPYRIRFETVANAQLKQTLHGSSVDRTTTAAESYPDVNTIPVYLKGDNRYWSFGGISDSGNGYFVATGNGFWKPAVAIDSVPGSPTEPARHSSPTNGTRRPTEPSRRRSDPPKP